MREIVFKAFFARFSVLIFSFFFLRNLIMMVMLVTDGDADADGDGDADDDAEPDPLPDLVDQVRSLCPSGGLHQLGILKRVDYFFTRKGGVR